MRFDRKSREMIFAESLVAVALLTVADYLTSWEFSLTILYIVIIGVAAYYGGKYVGLIIAVAGSAGWTISENLSGFPYTHWFAIYWNSAVRTAVFLVFAYMSARVSELNLIEKLAKTDFLTGVGNTRYLFEKSELELERSRRYKRVFTLVYIDLDGFKQINDTMGHQCGDIVLKTVAQTIRANIRTTDCTARLGGDEFAILLAETNQKSAEHFLTKMRSQLLDAMQRNGWNVTFSIGAMTYVEAPSSVDEMIRLADDLMYCVKREGKNAIRHQVFENASPTTTGAHFLG